MASEDAMRNSSVGWMTSKGFICVEHATPKERRGKWVVKPASECIRHREVAKPTTHRRRKTG